MRSLPGNKPLYPWGQFHSNSKRPKIEHTAEQLNPDCPLRRLFLDPEPFDGREKSPVKNVRIEAFDDLDIGSVGTFSSYLAAWLRSWKPKPKSGGIRYYPLSKIRVWIIREEDEEYDDDDDSDYGGFDGIPYSLDVLADQGKHRVPPWPTC